MAKFDEYLTFFTQDVTARAYQYYEDARVRDLKRVSSSIITASVEGTGNRPYAVSIDLAHPFDSECDCPYSEKGKMCKHMAAVYFAAFPEQAQAYEKYAEGPDDDWFDEEEDEFDVDYERSLPHSYDQLLDRFIASLSAEEKDEMLKAYMNHDAYETYHKYLEKLYEESLKDQNTQQIEKIHSAIIRNTSAFGPEKENDVIFDDEMRREIEDCTETDVIAETLKMFKDVRLYYHPDSVWLADYIIRHDTEIGKNRFANELEEHVRGSIFGSEWNHYYQALYELRRPWDAEELAYDLLRHVKLTDYASYVIHDYPDAGRLYAAFRHVMGNSVFDRKSVHKVLHIFADRLGSSDIGELADYYDYVYNLNRVAFDRLRTASNFREIILPRLLKQEPHIVKDTCAQLGMAEELFSVLRKDNDIWGMIHHAPLLDSLYHEELREIFTAEFYRSLETAGSRKDYEQACQFIRALRTLSHGDEIVDEIVNGLKEQDRYARRRALFEEIDQAK